MELISLDALFETYRENSKRFINNDDLLTAYALASTLPVINTDQIKHGHWIKCKDQSGVDNDNNNFAYFCSRCHCSDVHSAFAHVRYCWNCGAEMDDKESKEDE